MRRRTQPQFATDLDIGVRTLGSIEAGSASNYSADTRATIEIVLGWDSGSLDRFVEGGRPAMVERDALMRRLHQAWPSVPPDVRHTIVELAESAAQRARK